MAGDLWFSTEPRHESRGLRPHALRGLAHVSLELVMSQALAREIKAWALPILPADRDIGALWGPIGALVNRDHAIAYVFTSRHALPITHPDAVLAGVAWERYRTRAWRQPMGHGQVPVPWDLAEDLLAECQRLDDLLRRSLGLGCLG